MTIVMGIKETGLILLALEMAIVKWREDQEICWEHAEGREASNGFTRLADQFEIQCEDARELIIKLSDAEDTEDAS
jgi:hypothetical protein